MTRTLHYVSACYRAMLWLYPADLRSVYGRDMAEVFDQQLWTEWASRGLRGVLAAGGWAVRELFTVALPSQLLNERTIKSSVSLLITSAVLVFLEGLLHHSFLVGGWHH